LRREQQLVKALTDEVRKAVKAVKGVKVEPGSNGVRSYYRIKVGEKLVTIGFARKGDTKAAAQVGREAREPLTRESLPKIAARLAKQAEAVAK
jgi:hypothetical protein